MSIPHWLLLPPRTFSWYPILPGSTWEPRSSSFNLPQWGNEPMILGLIQVVGTVCLSLDLPVFGSASVWICLSLDLPHVAAGGDVRWQLPHVCSQCVTNTSAMLFFTNYNDGLFMKTLQLLHFLSDGNSMACAVVTKKKKQQSKTTFKTIWLTARKCGVSWKFVIF